jgi:predicted short-subunit dehydrogenase-like oxidoreductase (DUF2520 family)
MREWKLGLIGAGNLAWNLAAVLDQTPFKIQQVFSRHLDSAFKISKDFPAIQAAFAPSQLRKDLDLVVIASSDHGIAEIATAFAPFKGQQTIFAHTSGSIDLQSLAPFGEKIGVFYPLQTFTKGHRADFKEIPIFLEGEAEVIEVLRPLAEFLSPKVSLLDSQKRLQIHLGAVFASNFANFMWLLAEDSLKDVGDFDLHVYAPLIRECMEKALRYGPQNAQTGPALRGDAITMHKHLNLLAAEDARLEALYRVLSDLIASRFADKDSN